MDTNQFILLCIKYLTIFLLMYIVLSYMPNNKIDSTSIYTIILAALTVHMSMHIIYKNLSIACSNKEPFVNEPMGSSGPINDSDMHMVSSKPIEPKKEDVANPVSSSIDNNSVTGVKGFNTVEDLLKEPPKSDLTETNDLIHDGKANYENGHIVKQIEDIEKKAKEGSKLIWGQDPQTDLKYNELPDDMMKPLGEIDTSYTYMPPWKWWPPKARPPVCVTDKMCSPCPITTIGTPVDVKEWDASRNVTGGLGVNIEYLQKLNNIY